MVDSGSRDYDMPRTDWWGRNAIRPRNDPAPAHQFNLDTVGACAEHPNVARRTGLPLDYCRVLVELRAAQFALGTERNPFPLAGHYTREPVTCLLNSGSEDSYFRPEIARDLGLYPNDGLAVHRRGGDFLECRLYLTFGPQGAYVPILFPIERVPDTSTYSRRYRWRLNYSGENVLGMRGLLNRFMLCATPETLFVLARRPSTTSGSRRGT